MKKKTEPNWTGHIISAPKASNFAAFSGLIFMLQFLWHFAETADSCDPSQTAVGSLSPPSPPFLIHSLHAIWYLGGAWLPVGSFLSAPWHNVVFYGLLSRGFVLCFIFWVPVVVAVVVVCCLLALRAGSAPQAASLYYNILSLHFAFRIYFLLCTRQSRLLSLSALIAAFHCVAFALTH